jgi:hypothetical protein
MKQHALRALIPESLYKSFKLICVKMDLSLPKQTAELIRNFVAVQEENEKRLNETKIKRS